MCIFLFLRFYNSIKKVVRIYSFLKEFKTTVFILPYELVQVFINFNRTGVTLFKQVSKYVTIYNWKLQLKIKNKQKRGRHLDTWGCLGQSGSSNLLVNRTKSIVKLIIFVFSFSLKAVVPNSKVSVSEKLILSNNLWFMLTKLLRSVRHSLRYSGQWRKNE